MVRLFFHLLLWRNVQRCRKLCVDVLMVCVLLTRLHLFTDIIDRMCVDCSEKTRTLGSQGLFLETESETRPAEGGTLTQKQLKPGSAGPEPRGTEGSTSELDLDQDREEAQIAPP